MIPIVSLLIIVTISVLITRVGSVALMHTGLSREAARFQARSAFTGVGFTTWESEKIVNHPVRRKIIFMLMFMGNVGIVTAISSLILGFVNQGSGSQWVKFCLLVGGLAMVWLAARSHWLDRRLSRLIGWALKRYTRLEAHDLLSLLNLQGDYGVTELPVKHEGWLANQRLSEVDLPAEGIIVLGVTRKDGTYIGAPDGGTKLFPEDRLILYGRDEALEEVHNRRLGTEGDREHDAAVSEQKRVARREKAKETTSEAEAEQEADL
jgi:hypothetical protein